MEGQTPPRLYRFLKASLTPMLAVNGAGMLLSGGYIVFAGNWYGLWIPLFGFFLSPVIFPLLLRPAAIFARIMYLVQSARPRLGLVIHALSVGWIVFVMAAYAAIVFQFIAPQIAGATRIAAIVWAVAASVAPWALLARGDRENVMFTGFVLLLQAGCVAAALAHLAAPVGAGQRLALVAAVMAAGAAVQAWRESRLGEAAL